MIITLNYYTSFLYSFYSKFKTDVYLKMFIENIMKKDIKTVDYNETIKSACEKFKDNWIGCLIVTDNDSIVGIVTERDVIQRTICNDKDPKVSKINEIMTKEVISIDQNETVDQAVEKLKENNIKKLPVTSNTDLVGIITLTDITFARHSIKNLIEED